ncbi:hypothetical protein Taro_036266 [Colocasia esculenta]|uniref:Uncharacterized protein n=1 Tax=Colocasia esculenta TaxID=4460 RepID=A0A843WL50_COLES|nr:hypothetical protein [Colocasia esculenta]
MSEVQSGSACGPSTLWRSEVVVPVVRRSFSLGCLVSLGGTPGCSFSTSWRSGMCVPRVTSALGLTPLVLRKSCWARLWLWVVAFLCSTAL